VLALLLAVYARPWGNSNLKASLYEIAKTRASAGLRERVFNDDFAGLVIYVEHIEPPGDRLGGILIADSRDPNQRNTVLARTGFLVGNEESHTVTLRLLDGSIHTFLPGDKSYHRTDFTTYDVSLNLAVALARFSQREKDAQEMTLAELREVIAQRSAAGRPVNAEMVELHRKFSLPFACLVFGLVGVPLGIQPVRAVRSRSFSVSLVIIFGYYLLLTAGEAMAEKGTLPPIIALWMPNVVFAILGLTLFVAVARERSLNVLAPITRRLPGLRSARHVGVSP
jgi:lipopolysaccharide export system permease protein